MTVPQGSLEVAVRTQGGAVIQVSLRLDKGARRQTWDLIKLWLFMDCEYQPEKLSGRAFD